jgi:hypothetical protein
MAGGPSAAVSRPITEAEALELEVLEPEALAPDSALRGFTNLLVVSPFADGTYWFLQRPLVYEDSAPHRITVKRYFVTDFASIPRFLWSLLPKWDGYGTPSVVHDYLYWERKGRTRREADRVMLSAMKDQNVGALKRCLIYGALRVFGGLAWRSNARKKAAGQLAYVLPGQPRPQPVETWAAYKKRVGHPDP